ncbi:MAG: MFS transporter [Bacteroidetes bacterium 4572_117]|nr:MAG: MFS transporter [Bacteroidetes bacterium 4572_117]
MAQVGWIMSSFGLGSFIGSWLGGKLTDKIGFYKVMVYSLFSTGFLLIGLQYITSFWGFVAGIFITMTIADTFRPAMFVSLRVYSKPENQTRSITLIRLAINLGFAFGPFIGGIIISSISYSGLFWIDGLTCISAILLFLFVLKEKKIKQQNTEKSKIATLNSKSAYKDKAYLIFLGIVFIMAFVFFQLFSTIPLFYKEVHHLTEVYIGLIMALNGFLIFILEMPLVQYLEKTVLNKIKIILWSMVLIALSYFVFNISDWYGVLIISMLIITLAEMLGFPFTNAFAMNRATKGREGQYLSLYTMSFALALIFSSKVGMALVDSFGFAANWYIMGILSLIAALLCIWLMRATKTDL